MWSRSLNLLGNSSLRVFVRKQLNAAVGVSRGKGLYGVYHPFFISGYRSCALIAEIESVRLNVAVGMVW